MPTVQDSLKLDPSDIMRWNQLQEKKMAAAGNGGGWGGSLHTSPLFRSNLASEQVGATFLVTVYAYTVH